jgi:hypothetical protein
MFSWLGRGVRPVVQQQPDLSPYSQFPIPSSLFPVPYSQFPIPSSLFPVPYSPAHIHRPLFTGPYSPAPDYRPISTGVYPPAHIHRRMFTGVCSPVPVHLSLFAGRESQVLVRQFFTRRLAASERLLENPNACTTGCGGIRQQSPQVGASRSCRIASETQLRTVVSDKCRIDSFRVGRDVAAIRRRSTKVNLSSLGSFYLLRHQTKKGLKTVVGPDGGR